MAPRWSWLAAALIVAVLVGIALSTPPATSPVSSASSTPRAPDATPDCNSADAKQALTNAFEHSALEKIASIRVLDIANVVERSFDPAKPSRICAADLTFNTGQEHHGYEMHLNSDRTSFIAQVVADPGPSAAPTAAAPSPDASPGAAAPVEASAQDLTRSFTNGFDDEALVGRWIVATADVANCKGGPKDSWEEYHADHTFSGNENGGRWRLDGVHLHQSGQVEGTSFTDTLLITRADSVSFDLQDTQGVVTAYRRCPDADEGAGA